MIFLTFFRTAVVYTFFPDFVNSHFVVTVQMSDELLHFISKYTFLPVYKSRQMCYPLLYSINPMTKRVPCENALQRSPGAACARVWGYPGRPAAERDAQVPCGNMASEGRTEQETVRLRQVPPVIAAGYIVPGEAARREAAAKRSGNTEIPSSPARCTGRRRRFLL